MAPYPAKILPALQRLGAATVAIGIAAAVVASRVTPRHGAGALDNTRRMLHQVRDEVRAARAVAPNPAIQRDLRKTEAALAEIARITGAGDWRALRALDDAICQSAETAMLFLSTGRNFSSGSDEGSITILVSGIAGSQQFTFASGTSQANFITALNTFRNVIRVSASRSVVDANRIEFRSLGATDSDFVRVKELNGLTNDFIFTSALAMGGLDQHKDFGQSLITLSPFRP
jgi:hypothetical protein